MNNSLEELKEKAKKEFEEMFINGYSYGQIKSFWLKKLEEAFEAGQKEVLDKKWNKLKSGLPDLRK